ncbi:tryptophan 7-halogenase [Kitasatospora aureofaciens]|uniref:NAD(P)/FAD-dependent oxidoreductase n=1 Tax=Kitasatospora aureofaciens TaxID=1894 RepID=UPI001C472648|nr:tryptophan 7-halogenase [Kitasatospora aureofaciens]MBV6695859.1 tryptophan 7-halogenase [Kitasatospora aureofaciens]
MTTHQGEQPGQPGQPYDVVIVGTGLSGTMLGSILAKHGFRVMLLDGAHHPRFAVGESTIGQTLVVLRLISDRYGVPEIANLASFQDVLANVSSAHGQKSNFGFMFHQDGEEPDPEQTSQFRIPAIVGNAAHFFRQDTDAYMFHAAVRYGCDARQYYRVERIDFDDAGVTVAGADGSTIRARYLVDASGFRSPLARQLELREEPSRLKHHARSIFTHMVGVDAIDDHVDTPAELRPPVPWNDGTMHHIFERGWMWIIPFNNHPGATNPLCSVGIQLDPRTYPARTDLTAEEEFWSHVDRFPAVQRQLKGARSVREWVRTDRMQYSSTRTVGERWCLMSHAAGFIDPLFSRGLSNTCEIINALSWRLMAALREDDFAVERFGYVERLEQGLLDWNDKLVNNSFISFSHYPLWNSVFRIWASASVIGGKRILNALTRTKETGDDTYCQALDDNPYPGLWCPLDFYKEAFDELTELCEAVDAGRTTAEAAAAVLEQRVRESDWMLPALGFNDPDTHHINPTADKMVRIAEWATGHPRPEIRELLAASAEEVRAAMRVKP